MFETGRENLSAKILVSVCTEYADISFTFSQAPKSCSRLPFVKIALLFFTFFTGYSFLLLNCKNQGKISFFSVLQAWGNQFLVHSKYGATNFQHNLSIQQKNFLVYAHCTVYRKNVIFFVLGKPIHFFTILLVHSKPMITNCQHALSIC